MTDNVDDVDQAPSPLDRVVGTVPARVRRPVVEAGEIAQFGGRVISSAVRHPRGYWLATRDEMYDLLRFGFVPCIATVGIFTFVICSVGYGLLNVLGSPERMGQFVLLIGLRESVPFITGMVVAGIMGTAVTADLGARKIREELDALNTSQGQLGELVGSTHQITRATSGQAESIRATVERLPAALTDGRSAFRALGVLSKELSPVATNLRVAAPYLTTALEQLPATAGDLRGLLPSLDRTLVKTPATLEQVPAFSEDLSAIVPDARDALVQANPMLRYIAPYGRDLAAFFTNFAAVMATTDEAGLNYIRLAPIMGNTVAVAGVPFYAGDLTHTENPYPSPGGNQTPTGHQREFTRLQPDAR